MFKKTFSILLAALLQCLLPLAHTPLAHADNHADNADTHTHDTRAVSSFNVQTGVLYTTENTGGSLLPHFLNSPGRGGKMSIGYMSSTLDFDAGLSIMPNYSQTQEDQTGPTGHTGISVGIGKKVDTAIGSVYLSARETYAHIAQDGVDFYQDDRYETILKAELANNAQQKPYVFAGLIVPAYVPIEQMLGMAGLGFAGHLPTYDGELCNMGILVNTSVGTSLFNIEREPETVTRTRIALQTQMKVMPLEIDFGFNIFQKLRQKDEYKVKIWWDVGLSYLF